MTLPADKTEAPVVAELLNSLLECELSASETYARFFRRMSGKPGTHYLYRAEEQHEESADLIRARIRALGGTPVTTPGVWGAWPEAVEDTARVVGDVAELDALKQEEAHELARCRQLLGASLDEDSRKLVENVLVPRLERHLARLDALLIKRKANIR